MWGPCGRAVRVRRLRERSGKVEGEDTERKADGWRTVCDEADRKFRTIADFPDVGLAL